MYDEGWEADYVVWEKVPPPKPKADDGIAGWPNVAALLSVAKSPSDSDYREPALRIDMDSIRVHVVRRVEFDTVEHPVHRHRRKT